MSDYFCLQVAFSSQSVIGQGFPSILGALSLPVSAEGLSVRVRGTPQAEAGSRPLP